MYGSNSSEYTKEICDLLLSYDFLSKIFNHLSPEEYAVWSMVASFNGSGAYTVKTQCLPQLMNMDKKTVEEAIDKLLDKKAILSVEYDGGDSFYTLWVAVIPPCIYKPRPPKGNLKWMK